MRSPSCLQDAGNLFTLLQLLLHTFDMSRRVYCTFLLAQETNMYNVDSNVLFFENYKYI